MVGELPDPIEKKAPSGYQVVKVKVPAIDNLYGWSDTGLPILNTQGGLYLGGLRLGIPFPRGAEIGTLAMYEGRLYWLEREPKKDPQRFRLRSSGGFVGPYITGALAGIMVTQGGFLVSYTPLENEGATEWLDFIDPNGRVKPISHTAKTDFLSAPDRQKGAWIVSFGRHRMPTSKYPFRTDVYRIVGPNTTKVGTYKGEFNAYDLEPEGMYGVIYQAWEMGAWRLSKVSCGGKELQTIADAASPYYPLPR